MANQESVHWDWGNREYFQKTNAGFILFPYAGADAYKNRFFKSINKVGIGSLPFLPGVTSAVEEQLSRLVSASTETEEDRSISLYSVDEKERIAKSHEYGLMGIVRHAQQLEFIKKHHIYHMPYTRLRGVRLRADFMLLFQSRRKFGADAGIQHWANIKSFQVGKRTDIYPEPPWPGRKDGLYTWFKLDDIQTLSNPFPPPEIGHPAYFRATTRLAFEEAKSIEELSLIREPERRLYNELIRAGYDVQVREDPSNKSTTYDISDLRLILRVSKTQKGPIKIYFDPQNSNYIYLGKSLFNFEDLMYSTEKCLSRIEKILHLL